MAAGGPGGKYYQSLSALRWLSCNCNKAVVGVSAAAAKATPGVASYVQQVDGAIGYVEDAYVVQNHLIYVDMVNKANKRRCFGSSISSCAARSSFF
jgi:ABC-type phosphate transport system substrate-binding protein